MHEVMNKTTSMPKSVLLYELDKVRSLDLETSVVIMRKECKENIRPTQKGNFLYQLEI